MGKNKEFLNSLWLAYNFNDYNPSKYKKIVSV